MCVWQGGVGLPIFAVMGLQLLRAGVCARVVMCDLTTVMTFDIVHGSASMQHRHACGLSGGQTQLVAPDSC